MSRQLDRESFAAGAEFAARTIEAVAEAWTGPADVKAAIVDCAVKTAAAVRSVARNTAPGAGPKKPPDVSWVQMETIREGERP